MYVLIFSTILSENFSSLEEMSKIWSKMYIGLHVKYLLFLSFLAKLELSLQIFE
jgi:hypothetical protein